MHTDLQTDNTTKYLTAIRSWQPFSLHCCKAIRYYWCGHDLKPDTLTTITALATYVKAGEGTNSTNLQDGINNFLGNLNTGKVIINGKTGNDILRESFTLTRRFKNKTGRQLSFSQGLVWNKKEVNTYTDAQIHYIYPNQFDSLTNQLRQEQVPAW